MSEPLLIGEGVVEGLDAVSCVASGYASIEQGVANRNAANGDGLLHREPIAHRISSHIETLDDVAAFGVCMSVFVA